MAYRCYFFGTDGQLLGADTIIEDSDDAARTTAMTLFAQRAFAVAFDLRHGSRAVAALDERKAKVPAPYSVAA